MNIHPVSTLSAGFSKYQSTDKCTEQEVLLGAAVEDPEGSLP